MRKKVFNYYTMAMILKSLYENCMKAWEQQQRGEKVTACGMSDEDIEELCEDVLPNMMNPNMTSGQVKKKLGISERTLRRMEQDGRLKGDAVKGEHVKFYRKWDVMALFRKKRNNE